MLLPHMCNRHLSGEEQSLLLLMLLELELSLELEQQRVGVVLSIIYDCNQQQKISGYENEINLISILIWQLIIILVFVGMDISFIF